MKQALSKKFEMKDMGAELLSWCKVIQDHKSETTWIGQSRTQKISSGLEWKMLRLFELQ